MVKRLTAIELFAGCGGLSLGLKNAGFKILYANELSKDAGLTYSKNFPDVLMDVCDIRQVDPEKIKQKIKRKRVDVIAAGPPCQGFSTLTNWEMKDSRNSLFKNLVRFVDSFRPKVFVMENVSGLLWMKEGKTIKKIIKEFEKLSYRVFVKTITASDYGVPQDRPRVFLIGTANGFADKDLFPVKNGHARVTVSEALSDLSFLGINETSHVYKTKPKSNYQQFIRRSAKVLYNHESTNHSLKIQKRFSRIHQGKGVRHLRKKPTNKRDCHKFHPRKPSRTITTLPEDYVHYKQNRIPTVRELARLQSFPDTFVFLGPRTAGGRQRKYTCCQYTQVGNAVPPLMAEAVFKKIAKTLKT